MKSLFQIFFITLVLSAERASYASCSPPDESAVAASASSELVAETVSPNEEISPRGYGVPLPIAHKGEEIRTTYIVAGRSGADQEDPCRKVFYHGLELSLICRECPLPGFPDFVQDVIENDQNTVVRIKFRLSSAKHRKACESKLNNDLASMLQREKGRLGLSDIKVEVQRAPVWQLLIAMQDSTSRIVLAHDSQHVANLGDAVTMAFNLRGEDLDLFMESHRRGTIEFRPFQRLRGESVISAEKRTSNAIDLGIVAKQSLDHRQVTKGKGDSRFTMLPILQADVNRLSRQVAIQANSSINASDPQLISFLHSDSAALSGVFEPMMMDYEDFRSAFPEFTTEMLAEHLRPHVVTTHQNDLSTDIGSTQRNQQSHESAGLTAGINVGIGPLSLSIGGGAQDDARTLDTILKTTGIKLSRSEDSRYVRPTAVRVYHLAEGWDSKRINQTTSICISKAGLNGFLEETPIPQSYRSDIVERALDQTIVSYSRMAQIREQRKRKLDRLTSAIAKVDKTRLSIESGATSIAQLQSALTQSEKITRNELFEAGRNGGMAEYIEHIKSMWGWTIPKEHAPYDGRDHVRDRHAAAASKAISESVVYEAGIASDLQTMDANNDTLRATISEIKSLIADLESLDHQLESISE